MIQIMQLETVDEAEFDHVKCPQCKARLCGKPKNTKVHMLRLSRNVKVKPGGKSPLLFTCKKCKGHYLLSTEEEDMP